MRKKEFFWLSISIIIIIGFYFLIWENIFPPIMEERIKYPVKDFELVDFVVYPEKKEVYPLFNFILKNGKKFFNIIITFIEIRNVEESYVMKYKENKYLFIISPQDNKKYLKMINKWPKEIKKFSYPLHYL